MWNARLDESQAGIKIAGSNINNLKYADNSSLTAENEEEQKNLLTKVKEECEKYDLKLNIQKTKIMASGPMTSWQIEGEKVETVTDFIFLCSRNTVDGDWSHESVRCLLFGRKAITNLDSILENSSIVLLTNVCIVKAIIFPIVMYGCESWTIKKAESEELMLSKCGIWEDSSESTEQQRSQTSQS